MAAGSRLLARVQHHPSRAQLLDRLVPGLAPLPVQIIDHESVPPSPWLGYQHCLLDIPAEYDHLLVVQDDAVPCANLAATVTQIAERWPDNPVCLYIGMVPALSRRAVGHAIAAGARYTEIHHRDFVPCVAVLWPRAEAQSVLDWYQAAPPRRRGPDRADDGVIGRWHRSQRKTVIVTVPSLFEHPDDVPSTIKLRNHHRNALAWATDGADYDWT